MLQTQNYVERYWCITVTTVSGYATIESLLLTAIANLSPGQLLPDWEIARVDLTPGAACTIQDNTLLSPIALANGVTRSFPVLEFHKLVQIKANSSTASVVVELYGQCRRNA